MNQFRSTIEAVFGAFWYLAVVVALPVVALMTLGLWHLWEQGALLVTLLWWLVIAMSTYAVAFGWRKLRQHQRQRQRQHATRATQTQDSLDEPLPEQLAVRQDWSERDIAIWQTLCEQIEAELAEDLRWQQMQGLALATLAQTASAYHPEAKGTTWHFTLPEALLILEETSRRYSRLVSEYLPFAEKITVASMLSLYDKQDNIVRGLTWANRLRRMVRLVNPAGALLGEVRDLVTDRVFSQVSVNLQQSLQRLLLQEVAQVAIDLYSGRLQVSAAELSTFRSRASQEAEDQQAIPAEPLRVLVFGQVGAGKSSLVNALHEQAVAEADVLPVTDRNTVHALQLPNMVPLHLVDTPGYGVVESDPDVLITALLTADIWVLVTQLNRPARQADTQLLRRVKDALKAQPMRRVPPLLVVLSNADHLPIGSAEDAGSMDSIHASALGQLQLPLTTPIVACDLTQPAGAKGITEVVMQLHALEHEAVQVQFNRRRLELGAEKTSWRNRLTQVGRLGVAVGGQVRNKLAAVKSRDPKEPTE